MLLQEVIEIAYQKLNMTLPKRNGMRSCGVEYNGKKYLVLEQNKNKRNFNGELTKFALLATNNPDKLVYWIIEDNGDGPWHLIINKTEMKKCDISNDGNIE
jgi:hypothetical protein